MAWGPQMPWKREGGSRTEVDVKYIRSHIHTIFHGTVWMIFFTYYPFQKYLYSVRTIGTEPYYSAFL